MIDSFYNVYQITSTFTKITAQIGKFFWTPAMLFCLISYHTILCYVISNYVMLNDVVMEQLKCLLLSLLFGLPATITMKNISDL